MIMFPSTHDITPFNVDAYIRVALLMLAKGNSLLIVSKPRMDCVIKMVEAFRDYKKQILFRFTIGTVDENVSLQWEPSAPLPVERRNSLQLAWEAGYRTSVCIEPMLQGANEAIRVVEWVRPYVTDTVWIGKMNKARLRVPPGNEMLIARADVALGDAEIMYLYTWFKDDRVIRWKDSINAVVSKYGEV